MKISEHNIQTNEIKTYEVPDEVQPVEIFWDSLRSTRNMKLRETDVYGLSDRTMTEEMKTYRQALRDLPANTSDPANPTWPTKPS